ncbi:hypothetical protein AB5I41_18735 [Sphingomonas sp. MMS24-JH45]
MPAAAQGDVAPAVATDAPAQKVEELDLAAGGQQDLSSSPPRAAPSGSRMCRSASARSSRRN